MYRTTHVVCTILVVLALLATNGEARENKLTWMERQSEQSAVIEMTMSTFGNYLNAGPRPYHTFVTFTAPESQCKPCKMFREILEPVAETFHKARLENPPKTPLFFVEVSVENCRALFETLKIDSIPLPVLLPSTTSKKTRDVKMFLDRLSRDKEFSIQFPLETADLFQFLTDRTRIQPIVKKTFPIPGPYLVIGYVGLCVVVGLFGNFLWSARRFFGWLSSVGMLVFFLYNVSGGQYNRIRETPWRYGQNWIVPQSRNQCQVEGLVIAGAYFGASVMAVLIINSQRPDEEPEYDVGEEEKPKRRIARMLRNTLKQFPTVFSVGGMLALFYMVLWIYSQKSPGYNLGRLQFSG